MMKKLESHGHLPILSWCKDLEEGALKQAINLAKHPALFRHVAIMPDAHQGFGMPIGGVIASKEAVIPNAVGVDIGCGMGAVRTDLPADMATDKEKLRRLVMDIKSRVPVGEGCSRSKGLSWLGFDEWLDSLGSSPLPAWYNKDSHELDRMNLGTLGGGNHFIEVQAGSDGFVWLMLHSGSRNLGYRIANSYHKIALALDKSRGLPFPDPELAWLPLAGSEAEAYLRDMEHALSYARENRRIMMEHLKAVFSSAFPVSDFTEEINIHHNYAALESHFGHNVWVHRKGAVSARLGQKGIIPGSMGTSSYIVVGLGEANSFESSSHGAGRRMGRNDAIRNLRQADCDRAMASVVREDWKPSRIKGAEGKKLPDLSEAPGAYKDIDLVMEAQKDLTKILVKLKPLAVLKG
ncbi:RtcB family protein [Spirochaetota bacterium]